MKTIMDINYSSEVAEALKTGKPVVALESTVFSPLGLPSPANKEAYDQSLEAVQERGAVAAVTAVIDGLMKVGLSKSDEVHLFGGSVTEAETFHKVSKRPSAARSAESKPVTEAATFRKVTSADLPIAVAQSLPFGATMYQLPCRWHIRLASRSSPQAASVVCIGRTQMM